MANLVIDTKKLREWPALKEVGSLAETDANSLLQETLDVAFGAEEIGLEDGADTAGKTGGEALGYGDGGFGVRGVFHVDA